jgi:hypothetical protein
VQSGLLAFANEFSATCGRLFAYIGGIVVLALVAVKIFGSPVVEAAIDPAPRAQWMDVERPYRAFALTAPEFAEPEPDYAIRRPAGGGTGRKDVMSWGPAWNDPAGSSSRLMIEVYRPGKEIPHFEDAASAVAARTADLGGPYPLAAANPIDSKFGRVAVFGFTARASGQPRNCLGFAHAFAEPPVELAGWYCKPDAEVVEPRTIACALERLTLLMAASEPKITELFAKAELRRKPCAGKPTHAHRASNTERRDWISARKAPKLRGRVTAR